MDIINLSQYVAKSFEERPSGKGWINYGADNLYPQYLVDLYQNSATHNALCTSIAFMIFGEGLKTDDLDARLKIEEWSLNDEVRRACLDLKIQGGFALEVIFSIDRTSISKVRHLPFENIRSGEVNEREDVDFYYYSRDWADQRCKPEELHAFDPSEAVDFPVQILYVKPFSVGSFYYPKSDYQGSINYIELDKEIGTYHINNIKNGLAPSFTIHFKNGTPPIEERNRIRTDIENQLAGATNSGKFIITYSDQPERKPDFEPFPLSDADKQYQFLSTETTDKIMVGHRVVSPAMFGVKTAGQLGSTQELEIASQLFERQVINPFQRIVNTALKSLFRAAGITESVILSKNPPVIIQASKVAANNPDESGEIDLNLATDYLIELAEEETEEWTLLDSRKVVYDTEEEQDSMWAFASVPSGKPQAKSSQDNKLIKVRYAYMPKKLGGFGTNPSTGKKYESRSFCTKMVNAGNRVWRKEDLEQASQRVVNAGWGRGGADTYDIFLSGEFKLYKGGGSCQHYWERRTYLRKDNTKISVNKAKKIMREAGYKPMEANSPKVAKRPRDMGAGRGFVDGRGNWTTPVS